jgi:hypothetical protein
MVRRVDTDLWRHPAIGMVMTLISHYQQVTITGGSMTIYGRRRATGSATELDLHTRLGVTPWRAVQRAAWQAMERGEAA